ncbi:LLM class flavin-dependent oxidoreductase [Cnuibacter physcomitrellae]|uniref:LLM class flavin-dependent oxidoreductase n=1 Tax=Cnuibacter physcomitrellae TaxID=1619308 RepID=UPI002175C1EF|nr:LLM class flavin-dependent oxidoreductase [Cnuibacter physcomitrellae]MCS5498786.1 LLM class flavin-dependent oxidoreductase [Cnuibacter physcomitrellae]
MDIELGLDTFGDVTFDAAGEPLSHAQVLRNLVEQAVLADSVGVDFIGIGEHHREDFAVSSPEVVLAAIAARTERIRLGSAVTVLSSDDPIRVFQRFSEVDALSNGRAEVILGRGSFTESFPLFGFDLADYERLFEEKLDGFARVRDGQPAVYPPIEHGQLRTWIGVGGSPESVVRTARYGFGLMLAIIGGAPARFAPYVDLYHRAVEQLGGEALPVGVHSPGHIAETDEQAREELWPYYERHFGKLGAERGWPPVTRAHYDEEATTGSLYVGSPESVAQRIASTVRTLGLGRFDLKYGNGGLPHEALMRSIELYGTVVIPRVRELLAADAA